MTDANILLEDYYKDLMPHYYCGRCHVTLFGDEKRCPDCGLARPSGGFPPLELAFDPWLGHFIAERFFVNKRVGRGASGSVYRVQALPFGREFAIKIIDLANMPKDSSLTTIEQRINREIRALDELDSPHIVQLHEVLELPDSVVGIVMEYVRGITLDVFVSAFKRLPVRFAIELILQIASGVAEAHHANMIHRDLKPENIIVETLGPCNYYIHILDFGLVRIDDGLHLTQGFLGSPLYASPEQSLAGAIDHRSDIYSLGGILFFVLTGSPPLNYDSIFEILQAHTNGQVPSLQDVAKVPFPEKLERLVASMLARDPLDRPPSLSAVYEHLNEILEDLDQLDKHALLTEHTSSREVVQSNPLGEIRQSVINDTTNPFPRTKPLKPPAKGESVPIPERDPDLPEASSLDSFASQASLSKPSENNDTDPDFLFKQMNQPKVAPSTVDIGFNPDPTPSTAARMPWQDRSVILLAKEANLFHPKLISATDNGESIAFLTKDKKIKEVRWAGRLSRSPGIKLSAHTITEMTPIGLDFARISSFLNLDTYYLVGTEEGLLYMIVKESDGEIVEVFKHPKGSAIREISGVEEKLSTFILVCDNHEFYFAHDIPTKPRLTSWKKLPMGKEVTHVAVARDGDSFATFDSKRQFSIHLTTTPTNPEVTTEVSGDVKQMTYLQDGHVIALFRDDSVIELRHAISATKLTTLYDPERTVQYVVFGVDGAFLGFYIEDEALYVVDLQREVIRST